MGISIRPQHLKRYAQIATLLAKHGRSDLVTQTGLDAALEDPLPDAVDDEARAEALTDDLEAMGPTFIKLGQLLSSRVDLLPEAYTEALSRLREDVDPIAFDEVREIIERELGVRLSKAFTEVEEKPMAAASLGQVHRARLLDGRLVAIKVQRPGVERQIAEDFAALRDLAEFADAHTEMGKRYRFAAMLEEMRRAIVNELDYRREASNLTTLGRNLAEFETLVVPEPVEDFCTARVLTMTYVDGRSVTDVSPMALMEIDGIQLADDLFKAYLKQVLVDGFFHADPHPGNVFLTGDGRIALIDVGMVGKLAPELQDGMLRLLLAMTEGRGREAADLAIDMGDRTELFDREGFYEQIEHLVLEHFTGSQQELKVGVVVLELTQAAGQHGLIIPPQLTMLGKTLLNLDQVGITLDPAFRPNEAIQRNAAELMQRRMLKNASPSHVLNSLLETNEFVQRLPGRLNRVFDSIEQREFEVKLRIANDSLLLDGLQKIANRIATGAVLAALILAAAMLMRIDTSFRLLGYPGLAVILFVCAAGGAGFLFFDVIRHDRWARRTAERDAR